MRGGERGLFFMRILFLSERFLNGIPHGITRVLVTKAVLSALIPRKCLRQTRLATDRARRHRPSRWSSRSAKAVRTDGIRPPRPVQSPFPHIVTHRADVLLVKRAARYWGRLHAQG